MTKILPGQIVVATEDIFDGTFKNVTKGNRLVVKWINQNGIDCRAGHVGSVTSFPCKINQLTHDLPD